MSQSDARSIDSRRGSSGNSLFNLVRNRSRNSSSTNLTIPDPAEPAYASNGSGSRLRRFSSASRKMMPSLGTRSSSNSIRSGYYDEPQQLSPDSAEPAVYPSNSVVDGYKPVAVANANGVNSGRTRKFSRTPSQSTVPQVSTDNANANREASPMSPASDPYERQTVFWPALVPRDPPVLPSLVFPRLARAVPLRPGYQRYRRHYTSKKSFFSSTTAKMTGAAGAGGAAIMGLARRKSSRSLRGQDQDEASAKPNGMAAAGSDETSDVQQDSESEEEESSEEEQVAPKRNAKPAKGRGGAAAAAVASSDDDEEEEDSESEEEDDDDDDSSDDDFQDAPLADISEGEEEEDDHHRGAKAGAAGAAGAAAGAGAAARHRRQKSGSSARNVANGDAGSTYRPKGTAGASRRAGPPADTTAPGQASSSSNDTRARSETSQAVKDKAARVAKLTAADVASDAKQLHEDIAMAHKALNLFLNSRMIEAERIVEEYADSRLYYALGYALIATIKGFMTFEPADLAIAISLCKDAMTIAHLLRKPTSAVSNFGRFVRGTGQSPSALSQMDEVQSTPSWSTPRRCS